MNIKATLGKIISLAYASSEAISEAASTGSSIFISLNNKRMSLTSKYIIASSMAATTGIIHWVTNYFFQGTVIQDHFTQKDQPNAKSIDEEIEQRASIRRKAAYLSLKYGYVAFAIVVDFLEIFLLYSATKAWINDLSDGEDVPLSSISTFEQLLILLYYVTLDLPFIFTNEIAQTTKQITERFHFEEGSRPDEKFMTILCNVIEPAAQRNKFRKFVRISGAVSDTIEHLTPLVIIIPPQWILTLMAQPAIYNVGIIGIAGLFIAVVGATIFAQTYLFEGKYSEENLYQIAYGIDHLLDEEHTRWIPPKIAHLFHKLLYLGGPLHGIDSGLSILLTLREVGLHPVMAYLWGAAAFLASWLGNHFSEVLESQEALKNITNESLATLLSGSRNSLFQRYARKPNYGSSSVLDSKPYTMLLND